MTPPAATTISDLTVSGGMATLATNALSVAGNLLISGRNLSAGALNVNVAGDWANSVGAGGFITGTGTVTLNGASPTYSTTQTVVISTTTSGATINFTTDGSIPSISSTLYTSALAVTPGMTIMAIAVKAGMTNSAVGTTVYMYIPAPVPPVIVTTPPLLTAMVGAFYTYDLNAVETPAPTFSLVTSAVGMLINASTGLITWTPTASGQFSITVLAQNGTLPYAVQSYVIVTGASPLETTPDSTGDSSGHGGLGTGTLAGLMVFMSLVFSRRRSVSP